MTKEQPIKGSQPEPLDLRTSSSYEATPPLFTGWFKSRKAQRVLDKIEFNLLAQLVDARRIYSDVLEEYKREMQSRGPMVRVGSAESNYIEARARVQALDTVLADINAIKLQVYLGA